MISTWGVKWGETHHLRKHPFEFGDTILWLTHILQLTLEIYGKYLKILISWVPPTSHWVVLQIQVPLRNLQDGKYVNQALQQIKACSQIETTLPTGLMTAVPAVTALYSLVYHSTHSSPPPRYLSYIRAYLPHESERHIFPPSILRPFKKKKHVFVWKTHPPPKAAGVYPSSGLPHKGPEVLGVSVIMRRTTTSGAPENGRSLKLEAGSIGGWLGNFEDSYPKGKLLSQKQNVPWFPSQNIKTPWVFHPKSV